MCGASAAGHCAVVALGCLASAPGAGAGLTAFFAITGVLMGCAGDCVVPAGVDVALAGTLPFATVAGTVMRAVGALVANGCGALAG